MCIFSFGLNAQTFLSGNDASAALLLEASTLRTEITNVLTAENLTSDDYIQQYPDSAINFLLINAMTDVPVKPGDSPTSVESSFLQYIEAVQNSGIYTAAQTDAIRQALVELITQQKQNRHKKRHTHITQSQL